MDTRLNRESVPSAAGEATRTDDELIADLAQGYQESLGPLYARYAGAIFGLAGHSLDRAAAEEIVQDVFLAIWRSAATFDPSQGAFRPWLFQLAHWKILNELRRRRRRPAEEFAQHDEEDVFARLADREAGPEEQTWQKENGQIIHSALESLPARQRQAVTLAFLEEMSHEQVASSLHVPLGTAKTRIRSGLQILRGNLAPVAASLFGLGLALVGFQYMRSQAAYDRDERALALVTTSELVPLRLTPASDLVPAAAHANYRTRPGTPVAVLTAELLPAPNRGRTYQAWVRYDGSWTALGKLQPNTDGSARLIAEDAALVEQPQAVEITLEPAPSSPAPTGAVVLSWAAP